MPLPKDPSAPSVFKPEHLLREARRQRNLPDQPVPAVCVLDPDGDLVRHLRRTGRACPHAGWACYHTALDEFALADGTAAGIVGCAVGAPFAVLVAEQLFASGCRILLSITSAGRIADLGKPQLGALADLVLIDAALRDEGTSAHYLPADAPPFATPPALVPLDRIEAALRRAFAPGHPDGRAFTPGHPVAVHRGPTWTTDAPYRETAPAIAAARAAGALAVEMEAAALYAFATARNAAVACFAHLTNTVGQHGDDFEKGEAEGSLTALRTIEAALSAFRTA